MGAIATERFLTGGYTLKEPRTNYNDTRVQANEVRKKSQFPLKMFRLSLSSVTGGRTGRDPGERPVKPKARRHQRSCALGAKVERSNGWMLTLMYSARTYDSG